MVSVCKHNNLLLLLFNDLISNLKSIAAFQLVNNRLIRLRSHNIFKLMSAFNIKYHTSFLYYFSNQCYIVVFFGIIEGKFFYRHNEGIFKWTIEHYHLLLFALFINERKKHTNAHNLSSRLLNCPFWRCWSL